uniref:C-type lectin domain-containing protein n=1 Tax=Anas platyrhynchos platyrhynchos TaxID=8840 RepID=A0A493TFL1_ANAPP
MLPAPALFYLVPNPQTSPPVRWRGQREQCPRSSPRGCAGLGAPRCAKHKPRALTAELCEITQLGLQPPPSRALLLPRAPRPLPDPPCPAAPAGSRTKGLGTEGRAWGDLRESTPTRCTGVPAASLAQPQPVPAAPRPPLHHPTPCLVPVGARCGVTPAPCWALPPLSHLGAQQPLAPGPPHFPISPFSLLSPPADPGHGVVLAHRQSWRRARRLPWHGQRRLIAGREGGQHGGGQQQRALHPLPPRRRHPQPLRAAPGRAGPKPRSHTVCLISALAPAQPPRAQQGRQQRGARPPPARPIKGRRCWTHAAASPSASVRLPRVIPVCFGAGMTFSGRLCCASPRPPPCPRGDKTPGAARSVDTRTRALLLLDTVVSCQGSEMAPTWTPGLWLLGCLLLVPALWGQDLSELSDCSPGWVPVSGGCLGFFPWELSWSRAEAFCRRFGSSTHLASVHSEEELDEEVWIGLHRPLRSRSWQWSDGTAVAYNSWHRASFTRRRACAALQDATDFTTWEAEACSDRKPFICKSLS